MKQEIAQELATRIENRLLKKINDEVFYKLNLATNLEVKVCKSYNGYYVCLEDDGYAATRQLTATPLLATMFAKANIWCDVYNTPTPGETFIRIHIRYKHPTGGSNGLELGCMTFDANDNLIS